MDENIYSETIELASHLLTQQFIKDIPALFKLGKNIDSFVKDIMREIGKNTMADLFHHLAQYVTEQKRKQGFTVHENRRVRFTVVFGTIEIPSPYLKNKEKKQYVRPLQELFGVEGNRYSERVNRALADFGIEKSFERASKQFSEHYGFHVGRTTVRGKTLDVAEDAQQYVEERLESAQKKYEEQKNEQKDTDTIVVELDGCDIRTGEFMTAEEAGRDDLPKDKIVRPEHWMEVRTGLARPLDKKEKKYVCKKASYPEISNDLFRMACDLGLSQETQVVAPGDGGIGLMEELSTHFSKFQYILDRPHLRSHFYETAEALGVEKGFQKRWVDTHLDRINQGKVDDVIIDLFVLYYKTDNDRVRKLFYHVSRFSECVDYDSYKSQGFPIGSGEVESAHRYIPQERLKIAGACWHPATVNPMLALRVLRANDWWEDFWCWRTEDQVGVAS